ncbi:LOW QUALITY PROTEIN: ELKS/Rab6-interacting/CAST family member 1-like [Balaenoptera ricei]|uniref:LOW QUALITY PROTEIN: ELKS/Rab6-interacting/CAST family member 1-like n=1 Tax=Balaenoptera ricei TaxID=2746895 RepID=UPI0028BD1638|nr:LOW QUALITY PROTEIN: ELKS/Rab6-interacting/CAST family member 1-like [Balaenoptera ricei]
MAAARGRAAPGASRPSLALGPSALLCPLLLTALAGSRQRAAGEGGAVGGGVTDGHGEGKTGAGVREGDAVLHSAVTGREGNSCDQPSGREKKTLRGSSGDEHMQMTVQALQDELRIQRDLNQLFQQDSNSRTGEPCVAELTEENFQRLHTEHERQAKELFLLRKTLEEMELRIETQKQTLNARDESIKKFLEMLQSKGLSAKATEEDHERTRRLAEAEMHVHHLESLLEQKEKEDALLREEMHRRFENAPDSAKTKALQTVIEMKDSEISSMERGLRDLEEEIQMLKSNGALSTEEREEEMRQMEVYRSHSKFMKNKIGQVKQELSRKDTELLALQTKLETLTNQFSDSKQHIEVLKESLTAKESRAAILQNEVDALGLRLEEKETMLNKKTKQIQDMAEEKGTTAGEIHDLKDMLDVKERKVNVLQKKIENLQEQLRDKEKQMSSLKERVKSLQADTTNTDTALTTLEEALAKKERTIERLKDQRERDEQEKQEEIHNYKKDLKDLKEKVSLLQGDLSEKEASLLDLKEHASSLASAGLKKDSRLETLEIALEQKKEECLKMDSQLKKAHEAASEARASPEMSDRIQQLEREIARYKDDSSKAQAEVDRLLEILKEVESEKNDKDKKIAELERRILVPGPQNEELGVPVANPAEGKGETETGEKIKGTLGAAAGPSPDSQAFWTSEEQKHFTEPLLQNQTY